MSWLADRLGVHVNLRPLAAPLGAVAGGFLGGPLGAALGAGLFKTADNKAHGDSWTHALEQGALNGGLAYGAGALGSHFAGGASGAAEAMPGVQVTPGAGVNAISASPLQQSVMSRVMGGAGDVGKFITNNHAAIETAGNVAGGVMNAQAQNRQLAIQQQGADDQSAQVHAALAKQQAIQAAFAKMYANGLGGPPQQQGQSPATATPPGMSATLPPTDANDAQRKMMQRLGYAPPPSYGSGY